MTPLFRSTVNTARPGDALSCRHISANTLSVWRSQGLVRFSDEAPNWVTLTRHGYTVMNEVDDD